MGFYEKYIETVTKNDVRTRNSVDAIIGRIDEKDNNPHESKEVFAKIIEDPKLGDFFRAGNPNDFAQFNKLIMDNLHIDGDEAIGEGIALVKRRPITWQYQG